ncbi:MAG: X2-like carbohydrate binding domain-containing protein [Clostridia bacterium]
MKIKNKIFSLVLALILIITSIPIVAFAEDTGETIDISEYSYLVFTDEGVYSAVYYDGSNMYDETKLYDYGTEVTLTGTNISILIAVESGTHDITFSGVTATNTTTYGALYITGGTVNVTVADDTENTFNGYYTDIVVSSGATLNIDGGTENTGELTVGDDTDYNWCISSGIGSYYDGISSNFADCGTITISGAIVNAYGYSGGAAIGGSGATITINDNAIVNATSAGAGAAIGNSQNGSATDITITGLADVTAKNTATTGGASAIGGGDNSVTGTITISGDSKAYASSTVGTAIGGGYYGSAGTIVISDNAYVEASGGTNSSYDGAGIGSGKFYRGTDGTITIEDNAIVTATGGQGSAGIGSAWCSNIDIINITGGTVTATGGTDAYNAGNSGAGIGTGYYGAVNEINISGGTVTAYGELYGAAIGGGCESYGGTISITDDAYVVAVPYSNSYSSAIGNGYICTGYYSLGTDSTITIESADNFIAYSTDYFGDCTFTNTGDVEFIQINYFSTQVGDNKTTEVKDSEGNVVASFSSSQAYTGVILGIDSAYADDTYTVYYDGEIQMHKNDLSEGQFSDEFTITDGYSYYSNVEDAQYAGFYNGYIDFDVDMDYTDANVKLAVYTYNVLYSTNSYQWQINTDDGFVNIDGATSGEYTVPQTTVVGTYEYRVVLTSKYNYNGGVPMTQVVSDVITLTVGQADNEITDLEITGWTYGEYDEDDNSPTANATDGTISYTYYSDEDCEKEVEDITTANAGTYYVVASVKESDNYNAVTGGVSFIISVKELETTDISIQDIEESYIFTNSELEPIPTIMYGTTKLVQDTDYKVTYSDNTAISTGEATVTITLIGNYSGETSTTFDIVYADVESDSYSVTSEDWTNIYEITATDGYTISTSVDETFGDSITVTTDSEPTDGTEITFYIENADGTIAQETVTCKLDTVAPTGEIVVKSNSFKEFINSISFGMFFKNNVDITITGTDTLSDVATVEYQKVTTEADYNADGTWTEYSKISVTANEQFIVYAKITDNAGNVTIINSNGVTVYTDSEQATETISFTKLSTDNVTAEVTTNGNTILAITNDEYTLTSDDYSVSEEIDNTTTITFSAEYLDSLSVGDYTLELSYNPLGETYVNEDYNEAPTDTTIALTISQKVVVEKEVEVTGDADVTIETEVEEQLLEELFTEEEIALNVDMKVTVKVDIVEVDDMDEETQAEFTSYLDDYNASLDDETEAIQAMVFDISVIKSLAGVEETITNLDTPITITITIPEEYQADCREFFILRNHDGEITILEDLDTDPTTITIETDRFSNYTLNYVETVEDVETDTEDDDTVQTGDNSSPQIFIVLMFVSLLGIFVVSKKRLVK